ncbi:hypothetical protein OHA72_56550 [Dactylosporangium sp. NBC_01737]|uniref:hypothetical protein n=1 Tax=Dactylosporangium sp. NBC_01737 TaxID=2975959 RepID=UPI002E0EF7E7|nr:hypothetical protein OHA72_56550 [Dactylosporangium sp. NBC_01737]
MDSLTELRAPGRQFQLARATRTHSQIILMSNAVPQAGLPKRLEVSFSAVKFMSFPPVFEDLYLRQAPAGREAEILARHGIAASAGSGVYLLHEEHDWYVVSGPPQWAEAVRTYDAESLFQEYGEDTVYGTLAGAT